ncbi:MAG: RdgB/HAM1 family non-canonical purine NTP pyrophosphatase [Coriobacteriales bacterium]|jgi:XTP/dITP diphosphohydrolase|nr:RdgB/HAM1 family non-canonical purine NTP pyrophosphatase [Coriobacteriales bacterium]
MLSFNNTVVVATLNRNKIPEIVDIMRIDGWQFHALRSFGVYDEPAETADSFEGNALIKARAAAQRLRKTCILADDSGLVVDALGGAPGIHSARYAGEKARDVDNVDKLLSDLKGVPETKRSARFICVAAYIDEDGNEVLARGVCEGRIALEPRGAGGFGYDPVFLPDAPLADGRTMAELSSEAKNLISHRADALDKLTLLLDMHYEKLSGELQPSPENLFPDDWSAPKDEY